MSYREKELDPLSLRYAGVHRSRFGKRDRDRSLYYRAGRFGAFPPGYSGRMSHVLNEIPLGPRRIDRALLESKRTPTLASELADKIGKAADYALREGIVLVPLQLGLVFSAVLLVAQAYGSTSMTAAERSLNFEMALGIAGLSIPCGVLAICTMDGGDRKK